MKTASSLDNFVIVNCALEYESWANARSLQRKCRRRFMRTPKKHAKCKHCQGLHYVRSTWNTKWTNPFLFMDIIQEYHKRGQKPRHNRAVSCWQNVIRKLLRKKRPIQLRTMSESSARTLEAKILQMLALWIDLDTYEFRIWKTLDPLNQVSLKQKMHLL